MFVFPIINLPKIGPLPALTLGQNPAPYAGKSFRNERAIHSYSSPNFRHWQGPEREHRV